MLFAVTPVADAFNLNGVVSGGLGTLIVGAVIWAGKLILDRAVPSRSDQRANVTLVLEGLNNMVKVLQEEKLADSKRLESKQSRIDLLESSADKDYDRISELRSEIIDLRQRLATKDRHINQLVSQLRKLGAVVTGMDMDDLEITITPEEVNIVRDAFRASTGEIPVMKSGAQTTDSTSTSADKPTISN